jgi:hypothetical protein
MAYARGAGAVGPVPRYVDFHLLGVATNAAALVLVATGTPAVRGRTTRFIPHALGAIWGPTAASGIFVLLTQAWQTDLPDYASFGELRERNTARFTLEGDATVFDGYVSRFHLPYVDSSELKEWLSDPAARALLPANFRTSAEAVTAAVRTGACVDSHLPDGIRVPPGERLLASSFDRSGGEAGQQASVASGPITAPSGAFRLFYLGMDTGGSLKLRLKPEGKGKTIEILTERRHGTSTWKPITVEVDPEKTYRLEFKDGSRGGWGAVTLPTNEPPLSRLADQTGHVALPTALLALVFIFAMAARPPRGVVPQPAESQIA